MPPKTKEKVIEEYRCSSIEDAAIAVIARRGVDHATIQEIANEAGIAKGTIYVYFHDRDELLRRTADRAVDRLIEQLEPPLALDVPLAAKIRMLLLRQLEFFDANASLFRASMALSRQEHEPNRKRKSGAFERYGQRIEAMFAEARRSGEIRDLDPAEVAAVYRDIVRGVLLRRLDRKGHAASYSDEAEFVVSVLLRGIEA
jgi:TetR/AcrR family fatty acid metabolism transcriptional regulator